MNSDRAVIDQRYYREFGIGMRFLGCVSIYMYSSNQHSCSNQTSVTGNLNQIRGKLTRVGAVCAKEKWLVSKAAELQCRRFDQGPDRTQLQNICDTMTGDTRKEGHGLGAGGSLAESHLGSSNRETEQR